MPTYKFRVKVDNRQKALNALRKAIPKTLNEIGDAASRHAHDYAPVDTGMLKDSYIKVTDERNNAVHVGSPLEYAPYVELGTGPNYQPPPDWVTNNAQRGHHLTDPWMYIDEDDGEWKQGWFVRAQPHLRPAFTNHISEYIAIFKRNLKNA